MVICNESINQKRSEKNIIELLELVKKGEEIFIQSDIGQETEAVIIPFRKYKKESRPLGILKGRASYRIKNDFKITDGELFK